MEVNWLWWGFDQPKAGDDVNCFLVFLFVNWIDGRFEINGEVLDLSMV